jgi:hypothetical protein
MTSSKARINQILNSMHYEENMNTIILPMAYRRYRHSIRRASLAERTLPKMKNIETPIKAETGESSPRRFPSVARSNYNNTILAHSNNLSNRSVITV